MRFVELVAWSPWLAMLMLLSEDGGSLAKLLYGVTWIFFVFLWE